MQRIKQIKFTREVLFMLITSVVVTALFMAYLILAGIPMTQARNEFGKGVRAYEQGNYESAKEHLLKSSEIWHSKETDEYLLKLEEK